MADKTAPEAKIPEGYDSVSAFLLEARERFDQGLNADRWNREQGLDDMAVLAGEHYTTDAKEQRSGRPCLVINDLPQKVAQVAGDIRQNRPSIRVRPVEDADKDLAEIREGLIRFIERDNDATGVYIQTAENQIACGIGNFRVGLKPANDNPFIRDVHIGPIENAFAVVWDPLSKERTGRDAHWCFVVDQIPRKAYEKNYKDAASGGSSLTIPLADNQGWYTADNVRVTEYWRVLSRKVKYAMLDGGQVVKLDQVPEGVVPVDVTDGEELYACMYLITGQEILDGPFELPIDRVPIIKARGWELNIGDRRVRWGLIRFAKDPARLRSYWRSVSAEMLALAPKAKWLLHESSEGDQEQFRDAHASDDSILTWTGSVKPEFIPPPSISAAVLQESALNVQDMKDVTGLHDASLGIRSNETSGKAIMARQREGDVANYIYPDNLAASIKECGRLCDMLIPVAFDTKRTIRILGEDEVMKVQKINDPNDPNSLDINRGRYDIAVDTGPSYSTKRVEAAESMMAFVQAVPAAAAVTGDLIADAQDWPNADKFAERLKKALPQQFQEPDEIDPNTGPTPEQQAEMQAKQAQAEQAAKAQQMAQEAAMLELAEKKADVLKAQADAAKAEAEALKAQYEAGLIMADGIDDEENQFGQGSPAPEDSAMGEAPDEA